MKYEHKIEKHTYYIDHNIKLASVSQESWALFPAIKPLHQQKNHQQDILLNTPVNKTTSQALIPVNAQEIPNENNYQQT